MIGKLWVSRSLILSEYGGQIGLEPSADRS